MVLLSMLLGQAAASASGLDWKLQIAQGERRLELQDLPGAEACFISALRDARRLHASPDEIVLCMQSLAGVLQTEDKTNESLPLYQKSLAQLERTHGIDSDILIPTLILIGTVLEAELEYKLAADNYKRAAFIAQKSFGPNSLVFADSEHRLGRATFKQGQYDQAEALYQLSLSTIMNQKELPSTELIDDLLNDYIDLYRHSPERERVISSSFQRELWKDDLSTLSKAKGSGLSAWNKQVSANLTSATNSGRISLPDSDRGSGATSSATAGMEKKPDGWASSVAGKPSEEQRIFAQTQASQKFGGVTGSTNSSANSTTLDQINKQRIDFYERMIAIDIDTLGPSHPSVARDLSGLASIYLLQRRYDEAKPLLQRALKIYSGDYSNQLLVKRMETLLKLIEEEKNPPENEVGADFNFLQALPAVPLQAQNLGVVLKLNYLAFLSFCHAQTRNADTLYTWALADTALSCGEQSTLVASCLNDYGMVLRNEGRANEAAKFEGSAHAIIRRALAKQAAQALH